MYVNNIEVKETNYTSRAIKIIDFYLKCELNNKVVTRKECGDFIV